MSLPPPQKKDTLCHWDWGGGVAGLDLAQKGRAGDAIISLTTNGAHMRHHFLQAL
jgi:hypothetical protein